MKIGIIVAMDSEYERLSELIGKSGRIGRNTVILSKSGIGKVNSAVGTYQMIQEHHPDCIISTGVAGGLGEGVDVMDVVAGTKMVYHDTWCGEGNDYGQVQGLPLYTPGAPWIHTGLICSGDRFISDPAEEEAILWHFPEAIAVDMESCSIAQVCYLHQVPFISLRVISDSLKGDRGEAYADFWATVGATSFSVVRQFLKEFSEAGGTHHSAMVYNADIAEIEAAPGLADEHTPAHLARGKSFLHAGKRRKIDRIKRTDGRLAEIFSVLQSRSVGIRARLGHSLVHRYEERIRQIEHFVLFE